MGDHNAVSNPDHYMITGLSPQFIIEKWSLPWNTGNAIKYIGRHMFKGKPREDLRKAIWYLTRQYELLCAAEDGRNPVDCDDKRDTDNPWGLGFMRGIDEAQEELLLDQHVDIP
jgi:hypothetical protein